MNASIKRVVLISTCAATLSFAAGYKIPEQSLTSVALSAAYVANANGADASYYNPANMVWNDDENLLEMGLTYINLPKIKYEGTVSGASADAKSKSQQFLLPTLHFSSKAYGKVRYGFSITAPGGLSKRWKDPYQKASAEEFTLKVIELNPTVAYKVDNKFAIGGGFRMIYSKGIVKADRNLPPIGPTFSEDMNGDDISFGYNMALAYRPNNNIKLATTYRSKVNLKEKGNANGYINKYLLTHNLADAATLIPYNSIASVAIPLPATLNIAASYTYKKTTVEFVYERVYWSKYKKLDFNFADPVVEAVLGQPKDKNWKDTNTYRIGVTHQYNEKLKLMAGFAIDNTPIPSKTLGFELPDADAKLYSVGFEYKYSKKVSIGMSYLYDDKETRTISASDGNINGISGTFKDISAHLVTVGFKYRF
jgi:long-chain fatty acid transport protein